MSKTNLILTLLICLFLFNDCKKPEKSNGSNTLFNQDWHFVLNDFDNVSEVDFTHQDWKKVDLPHDFSIEKPFSEKNPTGPSGGYAYAGIGWYRKTFDLPLTTIGKKVSIRFEGIYRNSDVWINGHHLGHRPYGYSSFTYDLTPYLNADCKNNVITVKANTSDQPNSRWYTGAGIYRNVWLHVSDRTHLVDNGVFIHTNNATTEEASLSVSAEIATLDFDSRPLQLKYTLTDINNNTVLEQITPFEFKREKEHIIKNEFKIENPALWSIDEPNLYNFTCTLLAGDKVLDAYSTEFGIRTIRFDPDKGFFLNNQPIKLKGTNNHHDGGPLGAACFDYTHERQLRLLKEMGSNALRMSHNPPSPDLLKWADRLGFVVIDEIFDEWTINKRKHGYAAHFDEWYEKDIANWIRRDRNHTSVIAWSLGNEVPEQFNGEKGGVVLNKLIDASLKHDTTRMFTAGLHGIPEINNNVFGQKLDLVGYNYWESYYEKDHQQFPERIIYGSETVNYPYQPGNCRQMHTYNDWVNGQTAGYVAGEFLWTGFDYLGEAGIGEGGTGCEPWNEWTFWPKRGATCGMFDICGFKKPAYYFRKALWSDESVVFVAVETHPSAKNTYECAFWGWPKVQPHWNHHTEGDSLMVHVYTNIPEIELFVNGKSHGKKQWNLRNEAFPVWKIPYKKGNIEAIGFTANGQKVTHKIQTSGKAAKIALSSAQDRISPDKQSVAYIEAQLLDANNIPVPFADNIIEFQVDGNGILKATGNGNQESHTPFTGNKMEAYLGKCLAIVQSDSNKGEITIIAKSEGLETGELTLIAK
ncbi:MAG: DUF4982 domain-containing protein [Prolixibacteraceae bacterium]|jgi:beta-galactosidase|nr:DUF4982 domain-containing protein [Prolixibacteraceae bacterium]